MHDYFDLLTEDEKPIFSAIADFACSLGYKARKDKVKSPSYTFVHRKVKSQILRFTELFEVLSGSNQDRDRVV